MDAAESEVRVASQRFYAALNRMAQGDASSMAEIWSQGPAVSALHPIGGRQIGWEAVGASFRQVAELADGGEVTLRDQLIRVLGDVAYELGVESGRLSLAGIEVAIDFRVTNIYRREGGGWKIVHHHTDLSSPMLDTLKRLPPR